MWPVYAEGIERHFAAHLSDSSLRETLDRMG
jgi:hypothetical protein